MESTKLLIIILIVALIILIIGAAIGFGWAGSNWYTQIDNSRVRQINQSDGMNFEYTLSCFDSDGRQRDISFKTERELREGAYIMLSVQPLRGVTAWEEVLWDELPDAVREHFPLEAAA